MTDRIEAIRARHAAISASPAVADQQTEDIAFLLAELEQANAEADHFHERAHQWRAYASHLESCLRGSAKNNRARLALAPVAPDAEPGGA